MNKNIPISLRMHIFSGEVGAGRAIFCHGRMQVASYACGLGQMTNNQDEWEYLMQGVEFM